MYRRMQSFAAPKTDDAYIRVFLLVKERMMFIYARVLNEILLDFGKRQSRGFQPGKFVPIVVKIFEKSWRTKIEFLQCEEQDFPLIFG